MLISCIQILIKTRSHASLSFLSNLVKILVTRRSALKDSVRGDLQERVPLTCHSVDFIYYHGSNRGNHQFRE